MSQTAPEALPPKQDPDPPDARLGCAGTPSHCFFAGRDPPEAGRVAGIATLESMSGSGSGSGPEVPATPRAAATPGSRRSRRRSGAPARSNSSGTSCSCSPSRRSRHCCPRTLSWAGFGRSMLVLALIWWAWSAFVWAANAQSTTSPAMRLCLLLATVFIMISGLAVPHAFGSSGLLFAVTYTVVRLLHLALYADASRKGNASWSAIAGFGTAVLIGMSLLVAGAVSTGRRDSDLARGSGDRLCGAGVADARATSGTPRGRRRALRRALQPVRDHLPRRVDRAIGVGARAEHARYGARRRRCRLDY